MPLNPPAAFVVNIIPDDVTPESLNATAESIQAILEDRGYTVQSVAPWTRESFTDLNNLAGIGLQPD